MADQSPSAQPEAVGPEGWARGLSSAIEPDGASYDCASNCHTHKHVCAVQAGAGKFTVLCAGVYTAQILRKSGSELCLFVQSTSVTVRWFPTAPAAARTIGKNPYWLRSSSQ